MHPYKKLNCTGKPWGSGTVSKKRREEFQQKDFARENKQMKLEDGHSRKIDWEGEKKQGNKKAKKLSPKEIEDMMKPAVKEEGGGHKPEPSPAVKEEGGGHKPESSLDKRDGAKKPEQSLDKRDGAKEVPKKEGVSKEPFGPSQSSWR